MQENLFVTRTTADYVPAEHPLLAIREILNRALRELRYGFRIFKNYRHRRKVTIFGSARTHPSEPDYKLTVNFAKLMAKVSETT